MARGTADQKASSNTARLKWITDTLPSPVYRRNLQPGMQGDDVVWLRNSLAEIRGETPDAPNSEDFDGELKDRVIAFQRSRALADTGIVDTLTLIHLNTMANDPSVPLLNRQP